ncbi:MAG: NifB/NifX family molybdenum-iron cluster-binding protein [Dehalococcoides mccartyi]|uniref:NifB/NifX family molybdenum-iron cluster-binding protein n=1 Tax=Dehalococcoides mccartyi TaxID=61435 RepID=UPI0025C81CFE|nr:NifB/NifX family molybdenum-iron cluster-binding protein [Dehalococcoides mccartyi]MDN4186723.1 NifB/NifX family molybdenum-iron cluster-binding protein [Dehalococcoides mccartyi]
MSEAAVRDKVAVASYEGMLVNQHLGMAEQLFIYQRTDSGYVFAETRPTPEKGGGEERWKKLAEIIGDCQALLVNGIGETPNGILSDSGLAIYEVEGLVEYALEAIWQGKALRMPRRVARGCRRAMSGEGGMGCG